MEQELKLLRQRMEEMERCQREEIRRMREEHAKQAGRVRREFEMQLEGLRRAGQSSEPQRQVIEVTTPSPIQAGDVVTVVGVGVEESRRKLKRLEESLFEQEKSINDVKGTMRKEMESLKVENEELKWTIAKSREIFGKKYLQFERMIKLIPKLRREEEELLGIIEKEKKALCKINRENGRKEELVRKLKEKLARRQNGVAISIQTRQGRAVEPTEGKDALDIFPEEIWEMILGNVTDPRDLWNCYNSCSLFRRLLHQWSTGWLFEQALPYLFPYLPGNKLLECRLVSTGWKEKMDQFLQNHPSIRPHNEEACNPRTLPFVNPQEEKGLSGNGNGHLVFDSEMLPNLQNPEYLNEVRAKLSVWRGANMSIVSIEEGEGEDREDEANEQVWQAVYTFFRTFGELVWYLNFSVEYFEASYLVERKISQFLKEDLIELAPNLRRLRLSNVPTAERENMAVWTAPYPNLETLEVDEALHPNYLDFIVPFVRAHHDQLKKVSMEGWIHLPQLGWPSLIELHLCCNSLNSLESLLDVAVPNLSKLVLNSSEVISPAPIFAGFFEILGELTRTTRLTTLRLVMTVMACHNVLLEPEPHLDPLYGPPRVTTLELEFRNWRTRPYPSFEFLLYFPHLENLHVFWSKSWPAQQEDRTALWTKDDLHQISGGDLFSTEVEMQAFLMKQLEVVEVNKFMYSGEMYNSNIWELLPRLKVFSFQWDVYTRGEYEEHRRKRGEREAE